MVVLNNTPRLQLILDLIDSTSQKVLLFAPYKSAVKALSEMLTINQNRPYAVITGDTTLKDRNTIFGEFQDTPKYKAIVAHPGCMAHSLTLTRANTTIWAGPTTSLDTFTQANGRTYRVGQTHKTLIAMIGGTVAERRIYHLLGRNEALQNRFLEIMETITMGDEDRDNSLEVTKTWKRWNSGVLPPPNSQRHLGQHHRQSARWFVVAEVADQVGRRRLPQRHDDHD